MWYHARMHRCCRVISSWKIRNSAYFLIKISVAAYLLAIEQETERRRRPLARRRASTLRPSFVDILSRKPCLLTLFLLEGWKVLFIAVWCFCFLIHNSECKFNAFFWNKQPYGQKQFPKNASEGIRRPFGGVNLRKKRAGKRQKAGSAKAKKWAKNGWAGAKKWAAVAVMCERMANFTAINQRVKSVKTL